MNIFIVLNVVDTFLGAIRRVRDLIALGANVNATDKLGQTPLHRAVANGLSKIGSPSLVTYWPLFFEAKWQLKQKKKI